MTNPMAAPFRVAVPPPDWSAVFADPSLPMLVDIGCAKGRFLQRAATTDADLFESRHGRHNLLGLEIYEPLVSEANRWRQQQSRAGEPIRDNESLGVNPVSIQSRGGGGPISNLHFMACNANVSLQGMAPPHLRVVTILFPDPWYGLAHVARHVIGRRLTKEARVHNACR